jgi:hypothetical protein
VGTLWETWAWQFIDSGWGALYGVCRIPENIVAPTSAKLILECMSVNGGNWRANHAVKRVSAGAALNFATWDQVFAVTQTITAGRVRQTYQHDLVGAGLPVAGDYLAIFIGREGAHAADTLAGNLELLSGFVSVA